MAPSRRKRSNASLNGSTGARVRSFIARRTVVFRSAFLGSQPFSGAHLEPILLATVMDSNERKRPAEKGESSEHIDLIQAVRRQRGRELRAVLRPDDRHALRGCPPRRGRAQSG